MKKEDLYKIEQYHHNTNYYGTGAIDAMQEEKIDELIKRVNLLSELLASDIQEQPVSEPTIDINTPFFGNTGAKVPVSEPESCDHDFVSGCDGKIYCQKCPEVRIVNQENNKSISAEEWLENKMNDLNDKPKGENSFEDWYLMDYSFTLRTISEWMEEYTKLKSGGK
jgi:hypothetical protein